MKVHSIYDKSTGEVVGVLSCPDEQFVAASNGILSDHGVLEGVLVDGAAHYFDLVNTIRLRPITEAELNKFSLLPNNVDSIIISNLPIPCTIRVDDQEYLVDDGEFEFTTDTQGIYQITCEAFPYIPKSWEVEAV